jgi:DNA-binding GntR family transcriptional regulator
MGRNLTARRHTGAAHTGRSLAEQAYVALERTIVTLQIQPGTAVSETELSARLGIGRTPIREALQRLAREQLVVILPHRGVLVSEINVNTQLRLVEVRRVMECLVVRCAARRASADMRARFVDIAARFEKYARKNDDSGFIDVDREFNDLCIEAARNEFAAGAMSLMHSLSRRFWFLHHKRVADMPATAKLHADIARGIASSDEALAVAAAERLLDAIEKFTRATVTTDF